MLRRGPRHGGRRLGPGSLSLAAAEHRCRVRRELDDHLGVDHQTAAGNHSRADDHRRGAGSDPLLNDDNTWTLHADQTLTAAYDTATATGACDGRRERHVNTSTQQTIVFTLASLSGSATYGVTVFGSHFTGTMTLPASGLSNLYGLSQTAKYTCGSGELSLSFPSFTMHGTD